MTPASLLLLGLLPAIVAGTGETARVQLDLQPALLLVGTGHASVDAVPFARLGATVFLRPVTDDATPIPLQPFLQRISTVSLRFGGSHSTTAFGTWAGSIDADADVYVTRMVVLAGSIGASGLRTWDPPSLVYDLFPSPFHAAATVGIRLGDLRFDAGYRYQPRADTVPLWSIGQRLPEGAPLRDGGGWTLGIRAVLVERIDLRLALAGSFAGDVYGRFSTDYHASRRLGLLWGIEFAHGPKAVFFSPNISSPLNTPYPLVTNDLVFDRFGARFGLSWWWTRQLGLTGSYAASWYFRTVNGSTGGAVDQQLTVELSTRI